MGGNEKCKGGGVFNCLQYSLKIYFKIKAITILTRMFRGGSVRLLAETWYLIWRNILMTKDLDKQVTETLPVGGIKCVQLQIGLF